MKPEKVFKRYDVRGTYPEEIDRQFAERLGKALGTFSSRNYLQQVVVGKDTKESSHELKEAFVKGLLASGVSVLDAGTGPTDFTALMGCKQSAVSVQVTSSHLPLDTNGFKFMYPEGNGFLNEDLYQVQNIFREKDFETGEGDRTRIENARESYLRSIDEYFHQRFDSIDHKIVLETMGGAARHCLPGILSSLGAEVVDLAEGQHGGPYIDPPKPEPGKLEHVEDKVDRVDADMAFATDMDADRVAMFYDGEWFTGDRLFAVLADWCNGNVVASIDTSLAVEEVVEQKGNSIDYTRVGDPFVIDRLLETGASLAGEPNGHYCLPDFVAYNSGTLAAVILSAINLEEHLENVPLYYQEESKIEVDDKDERMAAIVETVMESYDVISDLDGIKFELEDVPVLVRPSGSSPYLRIKTESTSPTEALEALEKAEELVRNP